MKFFFILLLSACTLLVNGQQEKETYKKVVDKLTEYFNNGQYEAIFSTYTEKMKSSFPLEKSIAFFTGVRSDKGPITKREFIKFEKIGTYVSAVYQVWFEKKQALLRISLDNDDRISSLYFRKPATTSLNIPLRNTLPLSLPFKGSWTVRWGGETAELNYHITNRAQKGAFDFVAVDTFGKTYINSGTKNEDFYGFGKEILSPCDGEVISVISGVKDNTIGETNQSVYPGNSIIIKMNNDEFVVLSHFKYRSIKVQEGQFVKRGDIVGLCGNSGNSSGPHLHMHIQNIENSNYATSIKCFFENLYVNGEYKVEYSPIKNDTIQAVIFK